MDFRLVPKSVTPSDLERAQWLSLYAIFHNTAAFGANCIKFTRHRPIRSVTKISPTCLVFDNIWFMGMTCGISVVAELLVLPD